MKTIVLKIVVIGFILGSSLNAFSFFNIDIDEKIKSKQELINKYEKRIEVLKKQIKHFKEEKSKNPKLYEKKPLYENKKDKYIYRVKLYGASTDAINFMIKDDVVSVNMNIKTERKEDGRYFYSSQYFSNSYYVPDDVNQEKISYSIGGDYFEIIMPKK